MAGVSWDVGSSIVASLGPTNTGKTHRAVERMLEHRSGMIGLPLRLLAREVYDRVSIRVGENGVALVTGEEKRVPPKPRYWVCTVEAMPVGREVDFVAVDEVQLAAHRERGHAFTDRLLNLRGRRETWFLGSDMMRPLLAQLVPTATIRSHPRLSKLRFAGSQSVGGLPPRTAIVAFSMARVYELAERIRARRGGAAVVLGALSPRARNAQVALYQAGEVDYMVATDAIGMGLNLDIDHVAFADLNKFDGHDLRPLEPAELGQIAGRAGRHLNDGTFGCLAPLPPLPPRMATAIEEQRFTTVKQVMWRNSDLDFTTIDALVESLRRSSPSRALRLARKNDDLDSLLQLSAADDVRRRAQQRDRVELLWQVCRIPDFRQLMLEDHAGLLRDVFLQLTGPSECIDSDWMAKRIARIDDLTGDIDTLLMRMAFIRTWTYITHRSSWVTDARGWQERTRAIEDRLSDALHQQFVARFIDEKGKRKRAAGGFKGEAGELTGPFAELKALAARMDPAAAKERWVDQLPDAPGKRFELDPDGTVRVDEHVVGRLRRGSDLLHPEVEIEDSVGDKAIRSRIHRRLIAWTRDLVDELLAPIRNDRLASHSPALRGLLYQLEAGLGTTSVRDAGVQLRALTADDRSALRRAGVVVGRRHVFIRQALKPGQVAARLALCAARFGRARVPVVIRPGAVSVAIVDPTDPTLYRLFGFPAIGTRAVRADVLERVGEQLYREARRSPFMPSRRIHGLLACSRDDLVSVVTAMGYRPADDGRFARRERRSSPRPRRRKTAITG